jgi:hypothetical protein
LGKDLFNQIRRSRDLSRELSRSNCGSLSAVDSGSHWQQATIIVLRLVLEGFLLKHRAAINNLISPYLGPTCRMESSCDWCDEPLSAFPTVFAIQTWDRPFLPGVGSFLMALDEFDAWFLRDVRNVSKW